MSVVNGFVPATFSIKCGPSFADDLPSRSDSCPILVGADLVQQLLTNFMRSASRAMFRFHEAQPFRIASTTSEPESPQGLLIPGLC